MALHEVLHAVGIGTADSWDELVSVTGTLGADADDWLGSSVIDIYGTGADLIDGTSRAHIAADIERTRLLDDAIQEVVMDPNIAAGERKLLTDLDVAFLSDIGYSVSAVPEPANVAGAFGLAVLASAFWRRRRGRECV
ncbi:MAG: hypothetical protein J6386_09015 [Candidatus Synoicihabitans palmerolidicus]|nr:hypothetical protein [Candidatus Synoicihabitans palmerolidicus]